MQSDAPEPTAWKIRLWWVVCGLLATATVLFIVAGCLGSGWFSFVIAGLLALTAALAVARAKGASWLP
jgi:hypothetical protein